jgi:putative membrane protein
MLQLLLAWLHLIALGLGLGAVVNRGTALREVPDSASLKRVFRADNLWGFAAALWIVTGAWRYLGGIEKSTAYYNGNYFFLGKMILLAAILILEIWPMITLIRWRLGIKRGGSPSVVAVPGKARVIAMISHMQALLVVLMVFCAVAMARGFSQL